MARNEFICWVEDASKKPLVGGESAGRGRRWRKASGDRAAGPDVTTEIATDEVALNLRVGDIVDPDSRSFWETF